MDVACHLWINIPMAVIALGLIAVSGQPDESGPPRMDYRGLALIVGGMGLSVFGLQQAALWGWTAPATMSCIIAGAMLLAVFLGRRAVHGLAADERRHLRRTGRSP